MQICRSAIKVDSYFSVIDSYLVYPILVTHFSSMSAYASILYSYFIFLNLRWHYFFFYFILFGIVLLELKCTL